MKKRTCKSCGRQLKKHKLYCADCARKLNRDSDLRMRDMLTMSLLKEAE